MRQSHFCALTFEGIIGRALAGTCEYSALFGPDRKPRAKDELLSDPRVAKAMPDADEIERDTKFYVATCKQSLQVGSHDA